MLIRSRVGRFFGAKQPKTRSARSTLTILSVPLALLPPLDTASVLED